MEPTTPGGTATANTSAIASQQQHVLSSNLKKPPGRRKPRSQHETGVGTSNSHPQSGNRPSVAPDSTDARVTASGSQQRPRYRPLKARRPPTVGQGPDPSPGSSNLETSTSSDPSRNQHRRPPKFRTGPSSGAGDQPGPDQLQTPNKNPNQPGGNSRRAKFRGKLTSNDGSSNVPETSHPSERYHNKNDSSFADDLTSRLIRELSFPPYPDCPICFSSVHRDQPIWSCSPSIPTILPHDAEGPPQYCWTTFHLRCIRSWAAKSVKDIEDAWRARGEEGKTGDWRCPGCQGKREIVPKVYCKPGASVVLLQILNRLDYLPLIHAEDLVRALAKAGAVIHAPFHVIQDHVLLAKLQPV
ncbi:hypothetical protein AN958_00475 [Leucoagaricus sp. SymC.cos]|nr:hypothetical protein AN958_00475 [Leucoagaricus sp. SymC.cos]